MKKISVSEQVKAEVNEANTKKLLEEMEDRFKRIATGVDVDEKAKEINLSGMNNFIAEASAVLNLEEKDGKYAIEGDITVKPSIFFWIAIAAGIILLFVPTYEYMLMLCVCIALIGGSIGFFFYNLKQITNNVKEKFNEAVKKIK